MIGDVHDAAAKRRRADKCAFFESQKESAAAVQRQRRADCERTDAAAQQLLRESALCAAKGFADCLTRSHWVRDSGHGEILTASRPEAGAHGCVCVEPSVMLKTKLPDFLFAKSMASLPCYMRGTLLDRQIPGLEDFVAQLCALAGDPRTRTGDALGSRGVLEDFEVRRSVAYWRQVHTLLDEEECLTLEQFDHHYRELISSRVDKLRRQRERQVREVIAAAAAESKAEAQCLSEEARRQSEEAEAERRQARAMEQQASALAQRSEPGSVVVGVRLFPPQKLETEWSQRIKREFRWDCWHLMPGIDEYRVHVPVRLEGFRVSQ